MKKLWLLWIVLLLLTGCGAVQTRETVSDSEQPLIMPIKQQVMLTLPEQAAVPVAENADAGTLYLCNGYTVMLQTMPAGDLTGTLRTVTGFPKESLQLLQTRRGEADRYDCVWTAAGENGNVVCRAAILDDGNYHYVLTAMAEEIHAGALQPELQAMFNSYRLSPLEKDLNSGS